jgi:hypothetical protein
MFAHPDKTEDITQQIAEDQYHSRESAQKIQHSYQLPADSIARKPPDLAADTSVEFDGTDADRPTPSVQLLPAHLYTKAVPGVAEDIPHLHFVASAFVDTAIAEAVASYIGQGRPLSCVTFPEEGSHGSLPRTAANGAEVAPVMPGTDRPPPPTEAELVYPLQIESFPECALDFPQRSEVNSGGFSLSPGVDSGSVADVDELSPFVTSQRDAVAPGVSPPCCAKPSPPRLPPGVLTDRATKLQPLKNLPIPTHGEIMRETEADQRALIRTATDSTHVGAHRTSDQRDSIFRRAEQGLDLAEDDLLEFGADTRAQMARIEQQRPALLEVHDAEMRSHARAWRTPAQQRRYAHASGALIVGRKQLQMHTADYEQAELCARQVEETEQREIVDPVGQIKTDFHKSKRKRQTRHQEEVEDIGAKFIAEKNFLGCRREVERRALVNVMMKIQPKGVALSSPDKRWARRQRLTERGRALTSPQAQRALIARGRFERHTAALRLPPLDFEHL